VYVLAQLCGSSTSVSRKVHSSSVLVKRQNTNGRSKGIYNDT
jgi:hypothetical protein